jgi:hypothetical protein
MIDVRNPLLFESAAEQLNAYRRSIRNYHGRFVQVFLAMKFYQNELPSMYSGQYVATEVLQTLLDDLYAKASRNLNDCVFVLFENSYLARTGIVGIGNTTAQNTWRNNFNLQKGIGCYASANELSSMTFLNQSRINCRHLQPVNAGNLAHGHCRLCPSAAEYRSEDHRKWLKVDTGGNGYAVLDLLNIDNFTPYIAPERQRIPILPLMVTLYHDASPGLRTSRERVNSLDFAADFNFSSTEIEAYFDTSLDNPFNRALLRAFPAVRSGVAIAATDTPIITGAVRTRLQRQPVQVLPEPVLTGTAVAPPAVNSGWEGERYVLRALQEDGWTVYDVSRQKLGYDLLAKKRRETRYIDVKSSLGMCSPTLTAREWRQAMSQGSSYVLAVIENFNPLGEAIVYWVPDPVSRCAARESTQVCYSIARSSWTSAVVRLRDI